MVWTDGSRYSGRWRYGRPSGYGEFTASDGDVFKGYWKNYYIDLTL